MDSPPFFQSMEGHPLGQAPEPQGHGDRADPGLPPPGAAGRVPGRLGPLRQDTARAQRSPLELGSGATLPLGNTSLSFLEGLRYEHLPPVGAAFPRLEQLSVCGGAPWEALPASPHNQGVHWGPEEEVDPGGPSPFSA